MTPGPSSHRRRARGERGFALLIVLWTMIFLALLVTTITATGRSEAQIAGGVRNAALATAAADGAAREAIFRLLDGSAAHWPADGLPHPIRVPNGVAVVRITNEAGKIDLNAATLPLLTQLLVDTGVDRGQAGSLAAAIMDWRTVGVLAQQSGAKAPDYAAARRPYGPPDEDYRSIDELSLVLGMTPAIVQRLLPHVTVYGSRNVDLTAADPVVAQVVAESANAPGGVSTIAGSGNEDSGGSPTLFATVNVLATVNGARAARRAVVVVGSGSSDDPTPYRILSWDDMPG